MEINVSLKGEIILSINMESLYHEIKNDERCNTEIIENPKIVYIYRYVKEPNDIILNQIYDKLEQKSFDSIELKTDDGVILISNLNSIKYRYIDHISPKKRMKSKMFYGKELLEFYNANGRWVIQYASGRNNYI